MGSNDSTRFYQRNHKIMKIKFQYCLLFLIMSSVLFAQKIDTDSLLVEASKELNINQDVSKAIKLAQIGIKKAPNYLDFHLILGRSYQKINQIDSARFYFKHIIEKNIKYRDAFWYLTRLEIDAKNQPAAQETIEKALTNYPNDKEFQILNFDVIQMEENDEKSIEYLQNLLQKYPTDSKIKALLSELKVKTPSDRVGITYNLTTFDRNGVGPWHLIGLQYIHERKNFSWIGRINFTERNAFSTSNSGFQYEFESYFKNSPKSYSFANIAVSGNDNVFPKLRLAYSYYYNFNNGWEADAGIRYTKTTNFEFYAAAFGIGKYVGSYWFNFKPYLQFFESKIYPSFTATTRYYFNTKFDYLTAFAGYGTSPDERVTLGQFQQRFEFKSYRVGAGYYKLIAQNYCLGFQASYNNQEYQKNNFQNEYDLFFSVQYKF
jgi:YaiO family outer membrane protein